VAEPSLELADIFRRHGEEYRTKYGSHMSPEQHRVMRAIAICRTAALGGHVDQCDHCGHRVVSYNSCRNRHCPKCQALAKAKWLEARRAELLPVPYFHVVFTLPQSLAPLAQQNKRLVYNLLFQAASQTLLTVAADPKHLGAEIGFLAILHTWGQNLLDHPHVHCVVPGGGLADNRTKWLACRERFFLPVRVLSRLFRRLFLERLQKAFAQGQLAFHHDIEHLADPAAFDRFLKDCRQTDWVVYAKPPFGGPDKVLDYLARYTHRIAISNHRLLTLQDGKVTFTWRDYKHGGTRRNMTVDAHEFIRRFLLHVLPNRFMRVRYYGFLANRYRAEKLQLCRTRIGVPETPPPDPTEELNWADLFQSLTGVDPLACPQCKQGRMVRIEILPPSPPFRTRSPPGGHSS
jgi:hypothetical protein